MKQSTLEAGHRANIKTCTDTNADTNTCTNTTTSANTKTNTNINCCSYVRCAADVVVLAAHERRDVVLAGEIAEDVDLSQ